MNPDGVFVATDAWRAAHPGAVAGVLALRNVANPAATPALDVAREALQDELRARFGGLTRAEVRTTGLLPAYDAYYQRFGQTYHVLMQIESVALKGKPIPRRAALVEAAFMAELATGILTASHDLDALALPVVVDAATASDRYVLYNGAETPCKTGDMLMRDGSGILTSIILGPAARARLTPETTAALYCVYAPPGVGEVAVRDHLARIEANVRLVAPAADGVGLVVHAAEG